MAVAHLKQSPVRALLEEHGLIIVSGFSIVGQLNKIVTSLRIRLSWLKKTNNKLSLFIQYILVARAFIREKSNDYN
jgi:hypothetical protein